MAVLMTDPAISTHNRYTVISFSLLCKEHTDFIMSIYNYMYYVYAVLGEGVGGLRATHLQLSWVFQLLLIEPP